MIGFTEHEPFAWKCRFDVSALDGHGLLFRRWELLNFGDDLFKSRTLRQRIRRKVRLRTLY